MIGVIILALYYPHSIIGKKRGLILGALAGLGFTFTENFFYAILYSTAVVRAIIPLLGHICFSATAALGIALTSQKNRDIPLTYLRSILAKINTK